MIYGSRLSLREAVAAWTPFSSAGQPTRFNLAISNIQPFSWHLQAMQSSAGCLSHILAHANAQVFFLYSRRFITEVINIKHTVGGRVTVGLCLRRLTCRLPEDALLPPLDASSQFAVCFTLINVIIIIIRQSLTFLLVRSLA